MRRHGSFASDTNLPKAFMRLNKDLEDQLYYFHDELEYRSWYSRERLFHYLHSAPVDPVWNSFICLLVLAAIVWEMAEGSSHDHHDHGHMGNIQIADMLFNIIYALHVLNIAYNLFMTIENIDIDMWIWLRFAIDFATFFHYIPIIEELKNLKLICYFLRLHRPFSYMWELYGYNLNCSVLGTSLKYTFICAVLRIAWTSVWMEIGELETYYLSDIESRTLRKVQTRHADEIHAKFISALCIVFHTFLPTGPYLTPANQIERLVCMMIIISGCVVVVGVTIASLFLVISLYMQPEEAFRARYRLIMKEMSERNVPESLRRKVETFYRMYWHKHRAVSEAQLLREFPPTLPTLINTDIYFEATQRTRILCDLSFQFLSELAKKMTTTHYIPGDAIIWRNATKSSIIFVAFGDVEMLTAEDDCTPILRMTRGTVLSPCAGVVAAACARSHVMIRAASFCTTHQLNVADLWRVAKKYGKNNLQTEVILEAFNVHFENVKKHYSFKFTDEAKFKSSILIFKNNLRRIKQATDAEGNLVLNHPELFLKIANSYIMRNRTDSSMDESDAICLKSTFPCILQPDSSLQVAWQIVVSCCAVIAAVVIPYNVVFVATQSMEYEFFRAVVNVINIIDLIVHLSTGAHVEEGVPINFIQTASQQMHSVGFFLDVAAILPIFYFIGNGYFDGINMLLKLPKVFRNLKTMEDVFVHSSNKLRLLSYSLLVLSACYFIAALQQGVMCFHFGHCLVTNFTHTPYWKKQPLDDDTVESRIVFAFYWAITLMTFTARYEMFELTLKYWDNVIYILLLIEICTILFVIIISVYSATIMVTTFLRNNYDDAINNVNNFLLRNDVMNDNLICDDPQMRKRFITYLELCWYTDKAYSLTNKKKSIFHDLPPHVYQEIITRKRSKYILSIPFMKFLPRADLKTVSSDARLFYTSPNEILMNTGDIMNEMYVIKQGICEVRNPETTEVVKLLSTKDRFGDVECLLRIPAFYTVRAVTHIQVFCISKKKLRKQLDIPQIKQAVKFAKSLPEYRNLQLRRESFLFYEPPRPAPNREKFRLPKKYELDTDFQQPFTRLGFLAMLRYVFPRFTIRPDGKYLQRYEWFRGVCAMLTAMICTSYTYLVLQWPGLYFVLLLLDITAYYDMFAPCDVQNTVSMLEDQRVQRLLVGYYNEMGLLVYHPAATAAYYLKGTFIMDLMASIPMEFLEPEGRYYSSKYQLFRLSTVRQMLMMNRLVQLYRLPSALSSLTKSFHPRDVNLVVGIGMPFFLVLLNVLTSYVVFHSVAIYTTEELSSWKIVPLAHPGGSWLELFGHVYNFNITETPWNLHMSTYLWMVYLTTSTDEGSFHASSVSLLLIVTIGMVFGAMFITYFSVCTISIRANINKELVGFQEDLREMINFMRREDLDQTLQKEVLGYYEYNWDKMGGLDYNNILKLCDQITLRTDATLHIYGPTFSKCPFLKKCDTSLLRVLGREITNLYFLRNMHVFDVDDVISDVYFLDFGQVQVRVFYSDRSVVTKLQRGSVFGNLDEASMVRSQSTVVALTRIHVLQIKSTHFHRILADFPRVHRMMAKCRAENKNFIPNFSIQAPRGTKERISIYGSIFLRGRHGIINHLYFKDQIFQIYLIIISLTCAWLDLYNVGFQNNSTPLILVLYVLDFAFYMKILKQYLLPYIVDTDNLRKLLAPLRRGYFKGEFKYDLLSCLPIELFSLTNRQHRWMIFSWLRLNRLLRMVTVYKYFLRHKEHLNINLTATTITAVFIWFSLFIHIATCLWYFIGVMEDTRSPGSSWMHKIGGNGTWCRSYYFCSLYFTLTTFTRNGVGDIMPRNHSEIMFVCMFQILSMLVYIVYVGEFAHIIHFQSYKSFGFYCKLIELQHYLENNRVSKNLVKIVNSYALFLWREAKGTQTPYFLAAAPPAIKLKVMSAAYMSHLQNHTVFESCEPAFLRQLVGKLQMYHYNRGMSIVNEGEITDSMYIIHSGRVLETTSGSTMARTIIAGGSFGLVEGLFPDTPFKCSYKSVLKCKILTLSFRDWSSLLDHFPKSANSIYDRQDFDDNRRPHNQPKFNQEYRPPPREETEIPGDILPEGKPSGGAKVVTVEKKFPSDRRKSTPFAMPMKDTGSLNIFDSTESTKISSSDMPSELELTNVSLSERSTEFLKKSPSAERTDVQSMQTIKFLDSSETTTSTHPSTVSESLQGSMDLETKKKNIYSNLQRNESFPDLSKYGLDVNKGKYENLDKETLDKDKVEDKSTNSFANERATTSAFVGPLNSRISDEAIPLPTTPLAQVDSKRIEQVPKEESRKEDREKSKIPQSRVNIDIKYDDDIDQGENPEKATSTSGISRRVHIRYKDDSKIPTEAATSKPPETHDNKEDNVSDKESPSKKNTKKNEDTT